MLCYFLDDYHILVPSGKDYKQIPRNVVMGYHHPIEGLDRTSKELQFYDDDENVLLYYLEIDINNFTWEGQKIEITIDGFKNDETIEEYEGRKEQEKGERVNFCPLCGYDIVERTKGWYPHYKCKLCGKAFDVKVR